MKFGDQSVASVKVQAINSITLGQAARYSHVLCLTSEAVVTCGIALPLCGEYVRRTTTRVGVRVATTCTSTDSRNDQDNSNITAPTQVTGDTTIVMIKKDRNLFDQSTFGTSSLLSMPRPSCRLAP